MMPRATLRVCVLQLAISTVASVVLRESMIRSSLRMRMQPQLVAQTLRKVEDNWLRQAMAFAECDQSSGDCSQDTKAFDAACKNVVMSIVQGSSGDRNVVKEYMSDVCSEAALESWHRDRCQSFAAGLAGAMSLDAAENRDSFDSHAVCAGLWTETEADAKARVEKEHVARATTEKRAAEKRAELEKEEAAQRAEADGIAAEAKARAEEQRKAAEALAAETHAEWESRHRQVAEKIAAESKAMADKASTAEDGAAKAADVEKTAEKTADAEKATEKTPDGGVSPAVAGNTTASQITEAVADNATASQNASAETNSSQQITEAVPVSAVAVETPQTDATETAAAPVVLANATAPAEAPAAAEVVSANATAPAEAPAAAEVVSANATAPAEAPATAEVASANATVLAEAPVAPAAVEEANATAAHIVSEVTANATAHAVPAANATA